MASISKDQNGNRCIQFVGVDGKRRTIRLGKMSLKDVQSIKFRVELAGTEIEHRAVSVEEQKP